MSCAAKWNFFFWIFIVISEPIHTESKLSPLPPAVCYGCRIGKNCEPLLAKLIGPMVNICKETCLQHPKCLSIEYQIGGNSCSLYACLETSTEDGDGYEVVYIREAQVITDTRTSFILNMISSTRATPTDANKTKLKLLFSTTKNRKEGVNSTYLKQATSMSVRLSTVSYTFTKRLIRYQITTYNTTVKQSLEVATTNRMSEPDRSTAGTIPSSTDQTFERTTPILHHWTGNPLIIRGTNTLSPSLSVFPSAGYFQTSTSITPPVKSTNYSISPVAHGSANHLLAIFSDPVKAAAVSVVPATIVVFVAVMAAYYRVCKRVKHCFYQSRFTQVSPMESGRKTT